MSNKFGERLKITRLKLGISQAGLAKKLGISKYTLLNYENEKRHPDTQFLEKLVELTNVDLNWLFGKEAGEENKIIFKPGPGSDILDTPEIKEFFRLFMKYPMVRYAALLALEEVKFKHKDMFKDDALENSHS